MNPDGFRFVHRDGLTLVSCVAIEATGRFAHGFSTRRDAGDAPFDLGSARDRTPAASLRRRRFLSACGLAHGIPFVLEQVHGAEVVIAVEGAEPSPEADGVRFEPGRSGSAIPCVRTADCVPILLVDPRRGAAAAVHAGWRGTSAGIVRAAVRAMAAAGSEPASIVAALGPAIGPCCYETGDDVASAVASASGEAPGVVERRDAGARPHVDLRAANRAQLLAVGVGPGNVHLAPWCTRCRNDLFFSYRAEGAASGRAMAAVGPAGVA